MIAAALGLALVLQAEPDIAPLNLADEPIAQYGPASLGLVYRGISENFEVAPHRDRRDYEAWSFFQEVNPFIQWSLGQATLDTGVRLKHDLGGGFAAQPRFTFRDEQPRYTLLFGNYRMSWSDSVLYQPSAADDHFGVYARAGSTPVGGEALLSRLHTAADRRYERFIAAARVRVAPVSWWRLDIHGLIDHAAGFDTAGLPFRRPTEPTTQVNQIGVYTEINPWPTLGVHAEWSAVNGKAAWNQRSWYPHGQYRAAGAHAEAWGARGRIEYRRVDRRFVAPQGPMEYRKLYPSDRSRFPDAVVLRASYLYAFSRQISFWAEVEEALFLSRLGTRVLSNQNRVTTRLEVAL